MRKPCPQYHLELERVMDSEEIQDKLKAHQELFEELSDATGLKVKNFDDVMDIYSTLRAEVCCWHRCYCFYWVVFVGVLQFDVARVDRTILP